MSVRVNRHSAFDLPPRAILFDTDNTLFPYDHAHKSAMDAVRAKAARMFNIPEATFDLTFEQARRAIKERLGDTASSHNRLLYFQSLLECAGLSSQILVALDFEQTYWRTFLSSAKLFPGLTEFLDELRVNGVRTAVVTDLTAQIQFRKLIYFGLDRSFDFIVTSEEAGCDKPNPAPFHLAIQKMRAEGTRIWMVGDNPVNDIEGARKAVSAVTLQKVHDGVVVPQGEEAPDATFSDYGSLRVFVTKLWTDGH